MTQNFNVQKDEVSQSLVKDAKTELSCSFPALSCEFASVDLSDILGTNRLNITKTIRKFSIDHNLRPTGSEFHSGPISHDIKHGEEFDEEPVEGSVDLTAQNFDRYSHMHPILVVNFFAPWCYWSNRLQFLPNWFYFVDSNPSLRIFVAEMNFLINHLLK
ncbi:hypothetical protein CMV_015259 [Castanea mollissima]|uniref:Thioredoxin domain-containing protein n=1 Tax=Castanea mollissima TaxID=60419 RepID=A0A8J4VG72_9ROSI|nr:hypothetical protein CMV_015259 [Castanea mollissima]